MGIEVSNLPELQTPEANTLILGVDLVTDPDRSVKISLDNLQDFIVSDVSVLANQANTTANLANTKVNLTYTIADTANTKADLANLVANQANTTAVNASVTATTANNTANQANTTAVNASVTATTANNTANQANTTAVNASVTATTANNTANQANNTANQANTTAVNALTYSIDAGEIAELANNNSIISLNLSTEASSLASEAISLSQTANSRATLAITLVSDLISNTSIDANTAANLSMMIAQAASTGISLYTVNELRELQNPANYKSVITLGYNSVNDGNGVLWRWDADDVNDESINIIIPTGHVGSGRWVKVYTLADVANTTANYANTTANYANTTANYANTTANINVNNISELKSNSVFVVNTVNELRNLEYPTLVGSVNTLGCNTAGDGGDGLWRWDAVSTATDNTGTVVLPTGHSGAGRWLRIMERPVNAQWFSDGTSNSTAAFVWANTTGSSMLISNGVFRVTSSLALTNEITVSKDGRIQLDANVTLTINGTFNAGNYQVFQGDGTVAFGPGSIDVMRPEWWGAKAVRTSGEPIVDSAPAFAKAFEAAQVSHAANVRQSVCQLSTGIYYLYSGVDIPPRSRLYLRGGGWQQTSIRGYPTEGVWPEFLFKLRYDNDGSSANHIFQDFGLYGGTASSRTIQFGFKSVNQSTDPNKGVTHCRFIGLGVSGFSIAGLAVAGWTNTFRDLEISDNFLGLWLAREGGNNNNNHISTCRFVGNVIHIAANAGTALTIDGSCQFQGATPDATDTATRTIPAAYDTMTWTHIYLGGLQSGCRIAGNYFEHQTPFFLGGMRFGDTQSDNEVVTKGAGASGATVTDALTKLPADKSWAVTSLSQSSTLDAGISSSATSIVLTGEFPNPNAPSSAKPYFVTLTEGSNTEQVLVSACVTTDGKSTLTVTRARNGTTAKAFNAGASAVVVFRDQWDYKIVGNAVQWPANWLRPAVGTTYTVNYKLCVWANIISNDSDIFRYMDKDTFVIGGANVDRYYYLDAQGNKVYPYTGDYANSTTGVAFLPDSLGNYSTLQRDANNNTMYVLPTTLSRSSSSQFARVHVDSNHANSPNGVLGTPMSIIYMGNCEAVLTNNNGPASAPGAFTSIHSDPNLCGFGWPTLTNNGGLSTTNPVAVLGNPTVQNQPICNIRNNFVSRYVSSNSTPGGGPVNYLDGVVFSPLDASGVPTTQEALTTAGQWRGSLLSKISGSFTRYPIYRLQLGSEQTQSDVYGGRIPIASSGGNNGDLTAIRSLYFACWVSRVISGTRYTRMRLTLSYTGGSASNVADSIVFDNPGSSGLVCTMLRIPAAATTLTWSLQVFATEGAVSGNYVDFWGLTLAPVGFAIQDFPRQGYFSPIQKTVIWTGSASLANNANSSVVFKDIIPAATTGTQVTAVPQIGALAGLTVDAWVNTTNQVTVKVINNTGSTNPIDVPTQWTLIVTPAYNYPVVV